MLWKKIIAVVTLVPTALSSPLFILPNDGVNAPARQLSARQTSKSQNAAGQGKYTVVSGDTGNSIAAGFSITRSALNSANSGVNLDALSAGQTINTPSSRLPYSYKIVSGDTQSSIASQFNIFANDLTTANPSVNWNSPPAGQVVNVPGYGRTTTWTVYSGDTGYGIAAAFQVSFDSLSAANPGTNWNNLQIGQVLNVPTAVSPSTGTLPASTTTTTTTTTTSRPISTSPTTTTTTTTSRATSTSTLTTTTTITSTSTISVGTTSSSTTTASSTLTTTATSTSTCRAAGTTCIANGQCCPGLTCSVVNGGYAYCNPPKSTSSSSTSTSSSSSSSKTPTTSVSSSTSTSSSSSSSSKSTTTTTTTTTTTSRSTSTSSTSTTSTTISASVTGPLAVQTVVDNDSSVSRPNPSYIFYSGDGSPSAGWPVATSWISFNDLWSRNKNNFGTNCGQWNVANNSPTETQEVYNAIEDIAGKSGVDHRYILATILQESGGCVRAPTTNYGQVNPGLMQDFNGKSTCNTGNVTNPGVVSNPCPVAQIQGMIIDGTMGTTTKTAQPAAGLVQDIQSQSTGQYQLAQAYYRSSRIYNAGSIPANGDLGAPGATRCYVSDIANRLMGWYQGNSNCALR